MKYIIISLFTCLMFLFNSEVYAYEFPNSPNIDYIIVDESYIGEVQIYFSSDTSQVLSFDESSHALINVSDGNVYGYFNFNGEGYRITFAPFTTPTYRLNNTIGTRDLSIDRLIDTNIVFVNDRSHFLLDSIDFKMILISMLVIIGGLLCLKK